MDSLKRFARYACALLVCQTLFACTSETTTWSGTISDSAGVTIVMNTHDGMWADGEVWTFEEEMRFGALEAEPEYQFGQIGWITVGSNEDIYITDIQAQQVRVFTNDGQYVRTVGGAGNGPGYPISVALVGS